MVNSINKNTMKKYIGFALMALMGGLVAVGISHFLEKDQTQSFSERQDVYFANRPALDASPSIDFVQVAERANPTVVHIKTTIAANGSAQQDMFDPFNFFDQRMFPQMPREASGSGVIISEDGYIATNHHVIDGAEKIEVTLFDKRSYPAEVIGKDPETDLALLRIKEGELDFLPFGNSDELRVGEWVIAVGNPFNLTSTVTAGIVSAKGRNINLLRANSEYAIENFIQTDAAVNPGNSGGALVNTKGELVGINTAIASKTGSYAGYSFAVPVNIAKKVLDDLLKYGEVKRAILGVRIQDVSSDLASEKGLKEIKGVFIPEVIEDGAADKAGIKDEDIILSVNGVDVNKASELQEQISKYHPGDKVELVILRSGKEISKEVVLRSKEGETKIVIAEDRDSGKILGAEVENLTREEKLELGITYGVRITRVGKGVFRERGVPDGFIITQIDKTKVYTAQEVRKLLKEKKGAILLEGIGPDGGFEAYAITLE
jgi:serine protease Do